MSPKIRETDTTFYYRANSSEPNNNYISNPCIIMEKNVDNGEAPPSPSDPPEEEHAISGRLEIRVMSKEQMAIKEPSPNRDESIYFDAVVTSNGPAVHDDAKPKSEEKKESSVQYEEEFIWINKKEPQEKKYDIKVYEDSLKIQKYKIITVDKSEGDDDVDVKSSVKKETVAEVPETSDNVKEDEGGAHAIASSQAEREDIESTTDNRIENERIRDRDCSSSSNSKIPVFNPSGSRMLSQRSSWAGMEDGPDISDLTPGKVNTTNAWRCGWPWTCPFLFFLPLPRSPSAATERWEIRDRSITTEFAIHQTQKSSRREVSRRTKSSVMLLLICVNGRTLRSDEAALTPSIFIYFSSFPEIFISLRVWWLCLFYTSLFICFFSAGIE